MTRNAMPEKPQPAMEPVEEAVDHVRGSPAGRVIVEYGDYECAYSRQAFRAIERVEAELVGGVRLAFRHFPLTGIHPHALAAAGAAEAAALQGRFWDMHGLLFHCQQALQDDDLRRSTCARRAPACPAAASETSSAAGASAASSSPVTCPSTHEPASCWHWPPP
jgi:hypothetical protein